MGPNESGVDDTMTLMSLRAALSTVVLAGCTAALTGCGVSPETALTGSPETGTAVGAPINGKAFGGQQPINGGHVYVFSTGIGGYGTASTSLLKATSGTSATPAVYDGANYYIATNSSGAFFLSAAPACTPGTQAYVYIVGGDPGFGTNSAVGLLAPLGPCASGVVAPPNNVTFVQVNEITTVVTAYALAGYATSPTSISSANTTLATAGLTNAMNTALNIVNIATGFVPATSPVGNAMLPVAEIYTLANALASCVNSPGPTSTYCGKLLGDTGNTTDTAAAAIAVAHAPFAHTGDLFTLGTLSSAPFGPYLGNQPADFTIGLQYKTPQFTSGGVVNYSLAVDSGGNLWTRGINDAGTTSTFVKYSPLGDPSSPITVTTAANPSYSPYIHLAIDSANNLWSGSLGGEIAIPAGGTAATVLSNGSCAISTDTLGGAVFASNGTTYVGDLSGNSIWQFNATGCTGSLTPPAQMFYKGFLAPDPTGGFVASAYKITNTSDNSYVLRYAGGTTTPAATFLAGGDFLTTDSAKNVWAYSTVGGPTYDVLNEYTAAGTGLAPSAGYYEGGMIANKVNLRAGTEGVHIDGAGAAWLAVSPCVTTGNCYADIIVGLPANIATSMTAITPGTGLALPNGETGAHAVALDGSGNLWAAVADGSLIQFVGLTTPVATPTLYSNIGARP